MAMMMTTKKDLLSWEKNEVFAVKMMMVIRKSKIKIVVKDLH